MYLSALYVKEYANQKYRAFFEIGSSSILHNHNFSDEAVSFLPNLHSGGVPGDEIMQLEYESV